jgi:hypothetical protein
VIDSLGILLQVHHYRDNNNSHVTFSTATVMMRDGIGKTLQSLPSMAENFDIFVQGEKFRRMIF